MDGLMERRQENFNADFNNVLISKFCIEDTLNLEISRFLK